MHQQLEKMAKFKLATALQILLSRFNHPNERVRDTIQDVLSRLAVDYPGQSAWWIFHFLYFDEKASQNKRTSSISRQQFSKEVINRITQINPEVAQSILKSEKIFFELKRLSEK